MKIRKVAVVTGSATGVGRAVAWQLAERGIDIVVNYSRSQKEAEETATGVEARGSSVQLCRCDVSDEEGVRAMFREVADRWGRLDYLVNNAATTFFVAPHDLEGMSTEKWDRIYDVNVKGSFFCFREAVTLMKKFGSGSVVNISSVAALNGMGSCIAYAASKASLLNLTRSWAKTFAPAIRVNAVCPGAITTRWLMDGHQDMIDASVKETPMGRVSSPEDIAAAVRYFLLETDFVTGQWMVIDGGRTIR
ncbi:MAG: SDR family oxidoreductase [Planctomycetota bacterium]